MKWYSLAVFVWRRRCSLAVNGVGRHGMAWHGIAWYSLVVIVRRRHCSLAALKKVNHCDQLCSESAIEPGITRHARNIRKRKCHLTGLDSSLPERQEAWCQNRITPPITRTNPSDDIATSYYLTGVRKKSAFVTKAARNMQFFALIKFLFPEYKFKIFLKKYVIKQSFPRLKEQHLIGKLRFCPGFCWKFDSGKLFTLIYLAILNEKPKNHIPQCQSQLALSNGTLFTLLYAS